VTDAEICRTNGWKVGDVLEGVNAFDDLKRIQITAIGRKHILAVQDWLGIEIESTWSLGCRFWRKVGEA